VIAPTLPPCFGLRAHGDPACDGGPGAEPCGVVRECGLLTRHVKDSGGDRSSFLAYRLGPGGAVVSSAPISGAVDRVLAEADARAAPSTPSGPATGKPAAGRRKRVKGRNWRNRFPAAAEIVRHFRKILLEELPWAEVNVPPGAVIPGQIVELDEGWARKRVDYALKLGPRRRQPLAQIQLKRRKPNVDILIPVSQADMRSLVSAATMAKLHPRPTRMVGLPSICRSMDVEGAALAAEAVGAAARKGLIETVPAEDRARRRR